MLQSIYHETVTLFFSNNTAQLVEFRLNRSCGRDLICEASKRNIPLALLQMQGCPRNLSRGGISLKFSQRLFQGTVSNFNTIQCQTDMDAALPHATWSDYKTRQRFSEI